MWLVLQRALPLLLATPRPAVERATLPLASHGHGTRVHSHGMHVVLDFQGFTCDASEGGPWLLDTMSSTARQYGVRVVHEKFVELPVVPGDSPPGFTAVCLLDESHMTAHAYTDRGWLAIDVFTCGAHDPRPIADQIRHDIQARYPQVRCVQQAEHPRFLHSQDEREPPSMTLRLAEPRRSPAVKMLVEAAGDDAEAESDDSSEAVDPAEAAPADSGTFCYGLPGTIPPAGEFDPARLLVGRSKEEVYKWRESDLTHGRVAMLASVGFFVQPLFHPLGDALPALEQLRQLPQPLLFAIPTVIGFCESARSQRWTGNEVIRNVIPESPEGRYLGFYPGEPGWYPGDIGLDPLGLAPADAPEQRREMRERELAHCRLAMLAAAGFVAQEAATGVTWLAQLQQL